jgi:hypothetical protein
MEWLSTVEFIPADNGEARLLATEIIGHLPLNFSFERPQVQIRGGGFD